MHRSTVAIVLVALLHVGFPPLASEGWAAPSYILFESAPVRPLALSPDGTRLFALNTPDGVLEIFDVDAVGISKSASVPVGLEPVAVAARSNDEVWVVNHLSDSVSIVDVRGVPRVTRTLLVGDEPADIVFAGSERKLAFISAAHRGQNSPYPKGEATVPTIGRADVWVFDPKELGTQMGGSPRTILNLFSDKPRALTTSPDGSKVYAAGFHTGNRTTVVHHRLVCDTNDFNLFRDNLQLPCTINGDTLPGGYPPPHRDVNGGLRPETGLIVRQSGDGETPETWEDEYARDWSGAVNFRLADEDVFEIEADANPPVVRSSFRGIGTTLFQMAMNPINGAIYVANTEAMNRVRFEGSGNRARGVKPLGEALSVRGHLAETRITIIQGETIRARHLNKHIPYGAEPMPAGIKEHSLAIPAAVAVSADGTTLYVAAFGSQKIGVFDTEELASDTFVPDENRQIQLSGGGPSGVVLAGDRLFTITRFNNSVSVIDLKLGTVGKEIQSVPLHSPEPEEIIEGRPFLYDANLTSSNGEATCAACHIFADLDGLAWDLGNPDTGAVENSNPFRGGIGNPFPSMKGPMLTQSMRGLADAGPQHWRGDRQGDAREAFAAFNGAFQTLLGRDEGGLTAAQMAKFTDYVLLLRHPPNPVRRLDNSLRTEEARGRNVYFNRTSDGVGSCNSCHRLEPENGFFGTDGLSSTVGESQEFKIPQLRNLYQRLGMFGMKRVAGLSGPFVDMGEQVRGFGFTHDGSVDTLFRFLSNSVFNLTSPEQEDLEAFLVAYDSDLPPIVGQQITRHSENGPSVDARIDTLLAMAAHEYPSKVFGPGSRHCEVVARGNIADEARSWVLQEDGTFLPDDGGAPIPEAQLRQLASTPTQEITYTAVPYGSGRRLGVDRDEDGILNALDNCPDLDNPLQRDVDADGIGNACDASSSCTQETAGGDSDSDEICDATDNCAHESNPGQEDRDGDHLGDVCDSQDGTWTISSLWVEPRHGLRGRIRLKGTIDKIDASAGLRLDVSGPGLTAASTVSESECRTRRTGKIRCHTSDGTLGILITPSRRAPGRFRLRATIRGFAADPHLGTPLQVTLTQGPPDGRGIDLVAKVQECRERGAGIVCHQL